MRGFVTAVATMMFGVGAAHAAITTLVSENFDNLPAGIIANGTTLPSGLRVSGGAVEVIAPSSAYACTGMCVEMRQTVTNNAGSMPAFVDSRAYQFSAGDVITLTYDVFGNPLGNHQQYVGSSYSFYLPGQDTFSSYGGNILLASSATNASGVYQTTTYNYRLSGTGANGLIGTSATPWTYVYTFTPAEAGQFKYIIGGFTYDSVGPVIDNIRLTIASASPAPEPAAWAMMVIGFGAIGGAMRSRRNVRVTFAA